MTTTSALFLGTEEDRAYLPYLKDMLGGLSFFYVLDQIELLTQLEMYCAKKGITKIVATHIPILQRLLATQGNVKNPSLDDYAGSLFQHKGLDIVFISPLKQLFSVPHGKFIAERFISKVVAPQKWAESTEFKWKILENPATDFEKIKTAALLAVDIETFKKNLAIRCIGYTAVWFDPAGTITTHSYVLPLTSTYALEWMRKINELPIPKIFQNGKYDNAYLLRYNSPCANWFWDTAHLFHAWYSELPKDLAFLNAFFVHKMVYWKDLAETSDLAEYYRYNALDTWVTANVFLQWIRQAPAWAKRNYALAFPLVFPCLLSELTGIPRDSERLTAANLKIKSELETTRTSITKTIGTPINANSPLQVKKLLRVLGCADLDSSDEKSLLKASYRHPLNARILGAILNIRGLVKLAGTYLRDDTHEKGSKDYKGMILYSLNPHGTETGRLACRDSAFWTGFSIHQIPTGELVKSTMRAPPGFFIGECDLEQAESRDTAYIAGDEPYIEAVTGTRDFHSVNCSAFFGIPYEEIYDDEKKKVKNKPLRDTAKRVNHGANYNMGPAVLVTTMGLAAIYTAKKLLNLPYTDPIKIAEYLLGRFHVKYKKLRGAQTPFSPGTYYAWVVEQITISRRLTSRAYHHTWYNELHYTPNDYIESGDWTRYCFGNPAKSKPDLNSYVAHCPQSLNSRTLNEAYLKVFYDIALSNPTTFRLHAQIHDSILFSYKAGESHLAEQVRTCMEIPVTVRDVSGTYRTFTVPAALKLGKLDKLTGQLLSARYWNETE